MNDPDKDRAVDRWTEAIGWYGRLRDADGLELTTAVACAWQDWYADAENRRTFDDVSRLLADRDAYGKRSRPGQAELDKDGYDLSVPIAEWLRGHPLREDKERPRRMEKRWWRSGGLALAAGLVLLILSPVWFGLGGSDEAPTPYQTAVGGLRQVHLRDGSSMILGGQTKLLVMFSAQRRSVSLLEGQAWFKVMHDRRRPFIVTAGNGTIEDMGTAFLVTRESDRVIVTVTAGIVEVSTHRALPIYNRLDQLLTARPHMAPIRISRGEEFSFGDNGAPTAIRSEDPAAATAWTHGRLTFDDQPLRYVIETVDRYSSRRIVVSPAAGALRFSGIVFDNDIEGWLQSLYEVFPVTVEERGSVVRIKLRTPPPGR